MKALRIFTAVAFFGVNTVVLYANNDFGLPGEFLNFGVGGKPQAMGRAYTAAVDDINALYWNPGGLAMYRSGQIMFQLQDLEVGGSYHYLAYSQPLYSWGSFGVSVANVTSGDVPRIDVNNIEIGTFSNRETAYMGHYAYRFGDKLGLGGTLKAVENTIDGKNERGYGADAGLLYHIVENKYSVGVMARNLLPPRYGFESETEQFPTILRAGGAAYFFEDRLLTTLDFDKTVGTSQGFKWHFGLQTYFVRDIFLRLGVDQSEFTGGLGIKWKTMEIDYAAGFQEAIGLSNRVSLKIFFGGYEIDVRAKPRIFSPVGLRNKTSFRIKAANRRRIIRWILTIRNAQNEVVKSFQGYNAPPKVVEWDGRDAHGNVVDSGEYIYRIATTNSKGRTETTIPRSLRILAPTPFEIEAQ